jgi:hypothetical protein
VQTKETKNRAPNGDAGAGRPRKGREMPGNHHTTDVHTQRKRTETRRVTRSGDA